MPPDEGSPDQRARATYTKPAAATATSNTDSNSSGGGGDTSQASNDHQPNGVEVNLADYPLVRWALKQVSDPPDHFRDTACVLRACYDSGLTLQEAAWAVNTREDLAERLNDRNDDDLSRYWLNTDTRRRLRARGLTATGGQDHEPVGGGAELLDAIADWLRRFIVVTNPDDIYILTLWVVHTHLVDVLFTTPRLQIDSVVPNSGKTTVLDHLQRLCQSPVQAASLLSSALVPRMLENRMRTLLLDEVDKTMHPDRPGVADIWAMVNSGYRQGATRPVLVQRGRDWVEQEMPTFAPVAIAGNSPRIPDDTTTRIIRILLMPDLEGHAEESEWEVIEPHAKALQTQIAAWAEGVREHVKGMPVELPAGCVTRSKEKWKPLKRVAVAAGGQWSEIADRLIIDNLAEEKAEREADLKTEPPAMILLRDLYAVWPTDRYLPPENFVPTSELIPLLIAKNSYWSERGPYGKALTWQRFGRLLSQAAKITSTRPSHDGPHGYRRARLEPVWRRLGISRRAEAGRNGTTGPNSPSEQSSRFGRFDDGTDHSRKGSGRIGHLHIPADQAGSAHPADSDATPDGAAANSLSSST
jgi:hypothetical protein